MDSGRFTKLNANDMPQSIGDLLPFNGTDRMAFLEYLVSNFSAYEQKCPDGFTIQKLVTLGITDYSKFTDAQKIAFYAREEKRIEDLCTQKYGGDYIKMKQILEENLAEGTGGKYPVVHPLDAERIKMQIQYVNMRISQTKFENGAGTEQDSALPK